MNLEEDRYLKTTAGYGIDRNQVILLENGNEYKIINYKYMKDEKIHARLQNVADKKEKSIIVDFDRSDNVFILK